MSTNIGVGIGKDNSSKEAGIEACKQVFEKVSNPKFLIVFSSTKHNQEEMIAGVREVSGDIPLIGCSTAGEIVSEGSAEGTVAIMAIESDTADFFIGQGGDLKSGVREAGVELAENIKNIVSDPSCLFLLTDVLNGNGAEVVRGVQDVMGENFLIVGGAAGDDFSFEKTFTYCNDKVSSSSAVGAGMKGSCGIGVGVRHGWLPIGVPMKVTKSDGAIIYELDGKPAVSIYEDYFGKKAEDLSKEPLAQIAITYPLGMSIEGSDELLIRAPITVDTQGAITCAAEIPEGTEVRLMIGSKEEAIAAAKEAAEQAVSRLGEKKPKAALVFNCIARKKLFGRSADEEIKAIQEVLGENVPLIGFYTYGEISPIIRDEKFANFTRFHNETAVVVIIGE